MALTCIIMWSTIGDLYSFSFHMCIRERCLRVSEIECACMNYNVLSIRQCIPQCSSMASAALSRKEGMLRLLLAQMWMLLFGVELYYPNSQATYEGQLPPVLLQEGNIRFHVSSCLVWWVALPFCFLIVSLTRRILSCAFHLYLINIILIKIIACLSYRWISNQKIRYTP
jgi:hypothetical protein